MKLYVETNFVLTLALEQEHAGFDECTRMLELAEDDALELVLPAFALYEANHALVGKRRRREQVRRDLERELRDIQRSREFSGSTALAASFMEILVTSAGNAEKRFNDVGQRLLTTARLLPLSADIVQRGLDHVMRSAPDLAFPDAVVYASIMTDLEGSDEPSCFVTTNSKDFGSPDINDALVARDCKTLFRFEDALRYAMSQARSDGHTER